MRVAVLVAVLAALGAGAFFTLWVRTVDPRPDSCAPAARTCRRALSALGSHGRYDVAVSDDACVRARVSIRFGAAHAYEVYEVQGDGGERALVSGAHRPGSPGWTVACPPYELPPLPRYWWPTEQTSFTWYGDSERVERRIEGRGRVYRERRSVLEGGRWVEGAWQTYELDLAPDKPTKFSPENQKY